MIIVFGLHLWLEWAVCTLRKLFLLSSVAIIIIIIIIFHVW